LHSLWSNDNAHQPRLSCWAPAQSFAPHRAHGRRRRADGGADGTFLEPSGLSWHMPNTTKAEPRPLFTPSTLPQTEVPDPLLTFIEEAMLAIANRQEKPSILVPPE
jgi:hypothetical protein